MNIRLFLRSKGRLSLHYEHCKHCKDPSEKMERLTFFLMEIKENSIWNQSYMKELDIVASDENLKLSKLRLLHIGRSLHYFIRYTQNIQQKNKHWNPDDQSPHPEKVL